jgi:multicomponent K+:H+ antiporter subunit F
MTEMTAWLWTAALWLAAGAVGLAMAICVWRLLRGPDVVDRLLAVDTLAVAAVALIVLWGLASGSELLFEAALLLAMLGFVATVAVARFITRGDAVE